MPAGAYCPAGRLGGTGQGVAGWEPRGAERAVCITVIVKFITIVVRSLALRKDEATRKQDDTTYTF